MIIFTHENNDRIIGIGQPTAEGNNGAFFASVFLVRVKR